MKARGLLDHGIGAVIFLSIFGQNVLAATAQSPDIVSTILVGASPCARDCFIQSEAQWNDTGYVSRQLCSKGGDPVVGACITTSCSVRDSLDFTNLTHTTCHIPEADHRAELFATSNVMAAVALICFVMRMASKFLGARWSAEDTLIVISFIILIPYLVIIQILIVYGLGLNIWVLTDDEITSFHIHLFIAEFLYIATLLFIKASILIFFLRIFAISGKKFRILVWVTMGYNILSALAIGILVAIQVRPIWMLWEGWKYNNTPQKVVSVNVIALSHAGLNVALDVWMLILPLSQLYKLGLQPKKKVGVIAIFSVGLFLTIVSAIRIQALLRFATSSNATTDSRGIVIWSTIELCVGMMVACMPHVRQLARRVLSRWRKDHSKGLGASSERIFVERSLGTIKTSNSA